MSADRDIDRLLDAWFADGPMQVSDRVFDEAVGRVDHQRQRPAWRFLPWRFPAVSTPLKLAITGAALLAVLLGGTVFLTGGGADPVTPSSPTPTTTPAPTTSPTPAPTAAPARMEVQGDSASWTATVPPGWSRAAAGRLNAVQGFEPPTGISIGASGAVNVPSDPCDAVGTYSDAASPADVVAMLEARDDLTVSDPTETTLGGYAGLRVDVEFPADLSACGDNFYILFAEPDGSGIPALGPSNRFRIWVLDLDGRPIVLWISSFAGTPPDDLATAQQIVDATAITP